MGVGVGEATLGPASTSLLADYFENARLPLAYGIVGAAPFIGTGLANIVGGPLIDWLEARPTSHCIVWVSFTPGKWCWSALGCRASSWRR